MNLFFFPLISVVIAPDSISSSLTCVGLGVRLALVAAAISVISHFLWHFVARVVSCGPLGILV